MRDHPFGDGLARRLSTLVQPLHCAVEVACLAKAPTPLFQAGVAAWRGR
jgi:hypothetical protein